MSEERSGVTLTEEEYANPSAALRADADEIFKMAYGGVDNSSDPAADANSTTDDRPTDHGTRDSNVDEEKPVVGRDELLRYLESDPNAPPGSADIVRGLQRTISTQGDAVKNLEARLDAIEKSAAPAPVADSEPTPEELERRKLLNNVNDTQRATIQALIEDMGYVRKDEVERREIESNLDQLVVKDVKGSLDEFGEDFGTIDGDELTSTEQFQWNPEIKDGISQLYEKMTSDSHGILPRQLYILHRFPQLIKEAEERGRNGSMPARAADAARVPVSNGSVPNSTSKPDIYKKGDSVDDVIDRATLVASQQIKRMGLV